MSTRTTRRAFTSVDLLAVAVILIVVGSLLALLLPALSSPRRGHGHRRVQSDTQVRGIHQSLVTFAQGNNGWYPGLDSYGSGDPPVEEVYRLLLTGNYITGEYAISPVETKTAWTTGAATSANYSWAMLQVNPGATVDSLTGSPHARRKEWRDTMSVDAVVIADRNTGLAAAPQSIHDRTAWRGTVACNDGTVMFEGTHIRVKSNYAGVVTRDDHLFEAAGEDDAMLIYEGTGK